MTVDDGSQQTSHSDTNNVAMRTLLSDERQTPREHIHEVWQPVRMRCAVELPDVHDVVLILEHGSLVVVDIEIVGGTEDGHDGGESSRLCLAVHSVSVGCNGISS